MISDDTSTGPVTEGDVQSVTGICMPDEHLEGKVLVGKNAKYPLVQMISKGGTAVVYLAAMRPLKKGRAAEGKRDTMVAVKILRDSRLQTDPAHMERFKREAEEMSRISHQNIVKLYDFAYYENMPFLVTEYIPGESLRDRISRYNNPDKPGMRLGMDYIGRASQEICAGLGAVHAAGMIFSDVKPENVLCLGDRPAVPHSSVPILKIIDFGGARPSDPLAKRYTQNGNVYATFRYTSPEKLEGRPYDMRTDIYSTGIVIYEMLAGQTPFNAKTLSTLVSDIAIKKPPSLRAMGRIIPETTCESANGHPEKSVGNGPIESNIPETICRVIEKSLEKDPDKRFQTIDEFKAAIIEAWRGGNPVPVSRPKGRRFWFIAAAAAGIGAGLHFMNGKNATEQASTQPEAPAAKAAPAPDTAEASEIARQMDSSSLEPKKDTVKENSDSSKKSDMLEPRIKAPKKRAPQPGLIVPNPRYKANRN